MGSVWCLVFSLPVELSGLLLSLQLFIFNPDKTVQLCQVAEKHRYSGRFHPEMCVGTVAIAPAFLPVKLVVEPKKYAI